ncbi:MAG: EexN family lipoprotein [Pseudomonadota bacterium]
MMRPFILALALAGLAACSPQPRSSSYFEAHQAEAAKVVADCKTGAHRGQECANAQAAVASAKRDARMDAYRKGF